MATLSDALSAYRTCARAEGKSPKTIRWIMSSISCFSEFLGSKQEISSIIPNDFRRFIIALQRSTGVLRCPLFVNEIEDKGLQGGIPARL
jgi:hypothetical protein